MLRQDSDERIKNNNNNNNKTKRGRMRGKPRASSCCIKSRWWHSNVPMSSRENAACQVRCSRHSYLHHWLHVSSSINGHVQYPVCARSAPSRLDACALISSHSAVPLGSLMRAAPQSAGEMKKKNKKKESEGGKEKKNAAPLRLRFTSAHHNRLSCASRRSGARTKA